MACSRLGCKYGYPEGLCMLASSSDSFSNMGKNIHTVFPRLAGSLQLACPFPATGLHETKSLLVLHEPQQSHSFKGTWEEQSLLCTTFLPSTHGKSIHMMQYWSILLRSLLSACPAKVQHNSPSCNTVPSWIVAWPEVWACNTEKLMELSKSKI